PLLFVLLGECLTQRVGRINLGVEGQMLVGAAAGYGVAAGSGNPWLGLVAGAAAGAALSMVYASCSRCRCAPTLLPASWPCGCWASGSAPMQAPAWWASASKASRRWPAA
ncbi:MAG: hypothetical protein EOO29_53090, partial [Comamonadaceae bacterium]